jgi:hypothetical protein
MHVMSDRRDAQAELVADPFVRQSLNKQFEDFALTPCQGLIGFRFRRRFVVVPEGANQAAGDLGWTGEAASGDTEVLFGYYLIDEMARRSILEEAKFKKALKAHGQLHGDEMYAFTPRIALGADDVKNMTKAKSREHLAILASLHVKGGSRSRRKSP